ncbi:MAG: hypothetical protein RI560_06755 [Natronomonas sp.]|nr:hypothetical protein [Natronomonas sp.]
MSTRKVTDVDVADLVEVAANIRDEVLLGDLLVIEIVEQPDARAVDCVEELVSLVGREYRFPQYSTVILIRSTKIVSPAFFVP